MRFTSSRTLSYAVALVAAGAVQLAMLELGGLRAFPGFPLDDAWIHQVFARSIAVGHGFAYSDGQPSGGCSSPLWAAVLAVPVWLGGSPVSTAVGLCVGLSVLAALGGGWCAERLVLALSGEPAPAWAGPATLLLLSATPVLAWNGGAGMEGPAVAAAVLWACAARLGGSRDQVLGAGLFGLALATRLELAAVLPLLVWERWRARDRWGSRAAVDLGLALAPSAAMLGWLYASTGLWLPQTLQAKVGDQLITRLVAVTPPAIWLPEIIERALFGLAAIWSVATWHMPLAGAAIALLLVLAAARALGPAGIAPLGLPLGLLVLQPLAMELLPQPGGTLAHEGRYVVHLVMLGATVAVVGVLCFGRWLAKHCPSLTQLSPLLLGLLLLSSLPASVATARRARANRREILHVQVELGRWIGAHSEAGDVVAARDVGALGYFAPEVRVLDLMGLVSPERLAVGGDADRFAAVIAASAPRYIEVFDGEWSELTRDCPVLTRAREPLATVARRQIMVVHGCRPEDVPGVPSQDMSHPR